MNVIFNTTDITNGTLWNEWLPTDSTLFPPLTTLFEPPTGCSTEWIQNPLATSEIRSGAHDFHVPGSSAASDSSILYDETFLPTDYFSRCRPSKHPMTLGYSPGICTSGQTMAAVVERRYSGSTYWMGTCCDRFLLTIHTPHLHPYLHIPQGHDNITREWRLHKGLFNPYERSRQSYNHMDQREHDCHDLCR